MVDLIVIGAGPAGLAAALAAREAGLGKILVVEREGAPGGILNQCIHNGFGIEYFGEELTGPEYAERFWDDLQKTDIEILTETMALKVTGNAVHVLSAKGGYRILKTRSVILAMGCREKARGSIALPGDRPSGILTAGTAQRYVNIEGLAVGKRVVVLGSGDIGLIMARRMTLEGAKVLACVEIMPYSSGLTRNIVQCLNDFDIPLYLSHTITDIRGKKRLTGVTVSRVDDCLRPVPGSGIDFECDTLLLSVGLIPENELTRAAGIKMDPKTLGSVVYENTETSLPGVFACGNVLHVHDIADLVTVESQKAGRAAARHVLVGREPDSPIVSIIGGDGLLYALPQKIRTVSAEEDTTVYFRVNRIFRNATVRAAGPGGELGAFRRIHMAPGEMQRIKLSREMLQKSGGEITFIVKEENA